MIACPVENACKTVSDSAAARVSDVHRACWIGGNEFNENSLAFSKIGSAEIIFFRKNIFGNVCEPFFVEEKIHKPGTRNFHAFEYRAVKIDLFNNKLGNFSRWHFKCARAYHSRICGKVAVRFVCRYLDCEIGKNIGRSSSLGN